MNNKNLPEIVLGVVVNSKKEVLIIQRAKEEKGSGNVTLSWAFPGGKVEKDETTTNAVTREIFEETGYNVSENNIISEREHPQFPVYVYYFNCTLRDDMQKGKIQDNEIKDLKWVHIKKLKQYFKTDLDKKVAQYLEI